MKENTVFIGLNQMSRLIHSNNVEKGFWNYPRNKGETLMLIVTELAEAMEAHRNGNLAMPSMEGEIEKQAFEDFYKDTFEDEIADALIRILDMCGGFNIDIEFHVREKVKYNKGREILHGKNY